MGKPRKEPSVHIVLTTNSDRSSLKDEKSLQTMEKFFSYGGSGVLRAYASVVVAYALKMAGKDAMTLSALWRVEKSPESKLRILSQFLKEKLGIEVSPEEIREILGKDRRISQKREHTPEEEPSVQEVLPEPQETLPEPEERGGQPKEERKPQITTAEPEENQPKPEEGGEYWGEGEVKPAF